MVMRSKGYTLNHKTVLKLMRILDLKGKQRKNETYHSYKGEVGKIADNILKRDFHASKPFEKLATDVTQFKVCDEKVYLSPVMDLYNREIVSYSISTSPNLWQIREMLDGLFAKLPADASPDNGAMENFFGRLKVEMFYGEKFENVNVFIDELKRYIDYYNYERISMKLKGMSPVQYRTHSVTT